METAIVTPPPGRFASRLIKALAACGGDPLAAAAFAERSNWADAGRIKSALLDSGAGFVLGPAGEDFMRAVRARSVVGRLMVSGARVLRDRIQMVRQTSGTSARFVAEGAPVPVAGGTYTLDPGLRLLKVAGSAVMTEELARDSSAETLVMADLVRACAEAVDGAFCDPGNAGIVGEAPASVFNGAPSVPSSGTDADALRADLAALLNAYAGDLMTSAFVCDARTAAAVAAMPALAGGASINLRGASMLMGIPLYASSAVPHTSSGGLLGLVDLDRLEIIGLSEAELRTTSEATIQLSSTPDNPTTASTVMVSLFQRNLVAVAAAMSTNWRAAPGAAAFISGVAYGA